jgi:signal transduction histidine kinase/DNA-binding response OmpR family regulator
LSLVAILKTYITCCLLGCLSLCSIHAQRTRSWTTDDGLHSSYVSFVKQDRRGFIWSAVSGGVSRFDGENFQIYRDNTGTRGRLKGELFFILLTDQRKELYVHTEKGLQYYNPRSDKFHGLYTGAGKPLLAENYVFADDNRLWTRSRDTVFQYQVDYNGQLPRFREINRIFIDASVSQFVSGIYPQGRDVWLQTNRGLFELSPTGDVCPIFREIEGSVCQTWESKDRRQLAVVTNKGVYWKNSSRGFTFFPLPDAGGCNTRFFEHQATYYVVGNRGVYRLSSQGLVLLAAEEVDIIDAALDRQGNFWLGADAGGLRFVNPGSSLFTVLAPGCYVSGPPLFEGDGSVCTMLTGWPDSLAHLYPHKGYYRYAANGRQRGAVASGDHRAMALGPGGEKLGLFVDTAYWLRKTVAGRVADLNPFGQRALQPLRLADLGKGAYVIVSNEGDLQWRQFQSDACLEVNLLQLADVREQEPRRRYALLSLVQLTAVSPGKDDWLWLCNDFGIYGLRPRPTAQRFDRQFFPLPTQQRYLRPTAILQDRHQPDILWLGTLHGLQRFSRRHKRLEPVVGKDLLPSDIVYTLIQSRDGRLWLGTQRGLVMYDPRNGNTARYTRADGLPANEFNRHTAREHPDGRIFMGTVAGMVAFNPADMQPATNAAGMVITRVTGMDTIYPGLGNYLRLDPLPYNRNDLKVEFALLDFFNPELNQYRYRLLGKGDEWVSVGQQNMISFARLSPGSYVLEVAGTNGKGGWSRPARLAFAVGKPWWLTGWAWLSYVLLLSALLLAFFRYRIGLERERAEWLLSQQEAASWVEMENLKSRLFTNIAHEIRTPLSLIMGYAAELAEKSQTQWRDLAVEIQQNSRKMLQLIDQIRDLARLRELGWLTLKPQPTDVAAFMAAQLASFRHAARQAEIELLPDLPDSPVRAMIDPAALQSILINLLSNAIKFTPAGGRILLSLTPPAEGYFSFSVTDTGVGIAAADQARIFERYYQGAQAAATGGIGIGLAHTAELVALLQGEIGLESAPGQGSSFRVKLPFVEAEEVVGPAEPLPAAHLLPAETALPAAAAGQAKPLLLLVEDQPDMVRFLQNILQQDYSVITAANGAMGLQIALQTVPDLIISDVMMPEMDGLELCRRLKSDVRSSHIPLVMLTAKTEDHDKQAGLGQGADVYLTKPFDKNLLLLQLASLLRLRQNMQHHFTSLLMQPAGAKEAAADPAQQAAAEDQRFIQALTELIRERFHDPLFGVPDMERALTMSKSQLHRKMTALVGYPAGQALRSFRLQAARTLLLERPEQSVSDIAMACGFSDANYFSTAFRQAYGCSPKQFRQQQSEGFIGG